MGSQKPSPVELQEAAALLVALKNKVPEIYRHVIGIIKTALRFN